MDLGEIPGTTLGLVGLLLSALITAVGYVWKSRDKIYIERIAERDKEIDRRDEEIKAYRVKIDALQDKLLVQSVAQAEAARVQADTYQRLARSLEEQTKLQENQITTLKALTRAAQ